LKPDATSVYHITINSETTLQCPDGSTTTCDFQVLLTTANDETRLDRVTEDCTTTPAGAAAT
jgi:hypothetical protein